MTKEIQLYHHINTYHRQWHNAIYRYVHIERIDGTVCVTKICLN